MQNYCYYWSAASEITRRPFFYVIRIVLSNCHLEIELALQFLNRKGLFFIIMCQKDDGHSIED